MLQHDRVVRFDYMNELKARFCWAEDAIPAGA